MQGEVQMNKLVPCTFVSSGPL